MRHHFFVKRADPFDPAKECKPLRELKPEERARVARNKASVCARLPDMAPFFNELHEAGMIDGWRGVGEVVLLDPSTSSGRADFL